MYVQIEQVKEEEKKRETKKQERKNKRKSERERENVYTLYTQNQVLHDRHLLYLACM